MWTNYKDSRVGFAPVAQGIEHRFPNPKLDVGETGKRWRFGLFTGPMSVAAQPYCKTMEQHWSKQEEKCCLLVVIAPLRKV